MSELFDQLVQIVRSVNDREIAGATFCRTPSGYDRAVLDHPGDLELALLRWPAGTHAPLHGHGDSAALLWMREGRLVEDLFVPDADGHLAYRHVTLEPDALHFLPVGSFHRVDVTEASFGIHVYAPRPVDVTARPTFDQMRVLRTAWQRSVPGERLPGWLD